MIVSAGYRMKLIRKAEEQQEIEQQKVLNSGERCASRVSS